MRHDSSVIRSISYRYGPDTARIFQALPFFFIPKDLIDNITVMRPYPEAPGHAFRVPISDDYDADIDQDSTYRTLLPFEEFTLMVGSEWYAMRYLGHVRWEVHLCIDSRAIAKSFGIDSEYAKKHVDGLLLRYVMDMSKGMAVSKDTGESSLVIPNASGVRSELEGRFEKLNEDGVLNDTLFVECFNVLSAFISYLRWAEGKHLVRETPLPSKSDKKAKAKGDKKPWVRNDLPRYIYLDAPGKDSIVPTLVRGEGGKLKVGHHRRAHWRTLRHERFHNHPMYGKRIRVRPAWVGPTEWSDGRSVYVVHGCTPK